DDTRRGQRGQQTLQAIVQERYAGEIMKYALIDPQRGGGERLYAVSFQQTPMTQWTGRSDRTPVGVLEHREGEREGRTCAASVLCQRGAEGRKAGIQLEPGAEQEKIALERRQLECRADGLQSWRRGQLPFGRGGVVAAAGFAVETSLGGRVLVSAS